MKNTNGIRVNTGAKRIQVNDEGDYITLNFNDQGFAQRYIDMMAFFQAKEKELEPQFKLIYEHKETFDSMGVSNTVKEAIELSTQFHKEIKEEIDKVFGKNTCLKVFGDILPDARMCTDFFEQLKPYFEEHAKERAKKMNKYSAERKGNV